MRLARLRAQGPRPVGTVLANIVMACACKRIAALLVEAQRDPAGAAVAMAEVAQIASAVAGARQP